MFSTSASSCNVVFLIFPIHTTFQSEIIKKWLNNNLICSRITVRSGCMNYIGLGKTGLKISAVGFGGIPIIRLQTDEAVKVLRHAYDQGITFYDTANMYRDSEAKIGQALSHVRNKIIIATKTIQRNSAGFRQHLEGSLKMLKTDYIDLYQFHQVANDKEWGKITKDSGAWGEADKARQEGKIRFL